MTNVPAGYASLIAQMSQATGLPQSVIAAQANDESGFNPNAVSNTGAEGWLQFEPTTYNAVAAQAGVAPGTEFNPADEAKAYDVFMNQLLKEEGGSVQKALAAYNAGPGDIAAGMGYANTILSNAGTGNITVPTTGGSSSPGGGTSSGATAAAILDDFPGGSFNPLNWPSEAGQAAGGAIAGQITAGIGNGIESAVEGIFGSIMTNLGFRSGKDFLIRAGLIIAGFIILVIGIKGFVSSGSSAFSGGAGGSGGGGGEESDSDSESRDSEETTGGNSPSTRSSGPGREAPRARRSAASGSSSPHPSKTKSAARDGALSPKKVLGKDAVEAAVIA